MELIWKKVGETPLEALERHRALRPELAGVPMTYAGRLDPIAEGQLLILAGEECKDKAAYLGLDKEYEVEVVFGIETDTHDALGLAVLGQNLAQNDRVMRETMLQRYVGKFKQEYPAYSSKTVGGKQLHELARADELPDEMPTKEVEIYSIELLEERILSSSDLKAQIFSMINKVKGDFRQKEILGRWDEALSGRIDGFSIIKIRVKCSSGTYMRSLAHRMGGFALTIKRTKICL